MKQILTALFGETTREAVLAAVVSFLGYMATTYLGGWDKGLKILIALMIFDYVTGVLGAIRGHRLNSETMFWGGVRKGIVLMVLSLAVMADQFINNDSPVIRTLAIYFYVGREGLSVVENLGILGVKMPPALVKVLEQLQEKGGDENGKGI